MGLWQRLVGEVETRDAPTTWDLLRLNTLPLDGVTPVSATMAESMSTVFGCVRLISEAIAAMPLNVFRVDGEGNRAQDTRHAVARLFAGDANDNQTGPEVVETVTASALLNGCGYCEVKRDGNGSPVGLVPLAFGLVSPVRLPSGKIAYDVSDASGGMTRRLLTSDLLVIRDRTDDAGLTVRSRLSRCASTVEGAWLAEQFASSFFRSGAALSGVFSHPNKLSKDGTERLRQALESKFTGPGKAGRMMLLQEGLEWTPISAAPDKSQALESRRLSVEAIARIYGVPPVLLGDLSHANFSNAVALNQQFLVYALQPWLVRWEARILSSLFSEAGRLTNEVEFDTDLLLRSNMLERFQSYRIARETGLYNANELRKFEKANRRTDDGGDSYLEPLNMANPQEGAPKDREAANV